MLSNLKFNIEVVKMGNLKTTQTKNGKIVLTYGTFDLFHIGHLRLLKRLKDLGDFLIVGVSSDKFNLEKGKKTIIPFEQRAEIVGSIEWVDKVIEEKSWNQKKEDIVRHEVDIFAMGSDWVGKFDHLKDHCEVVYLQRTPDVSSTKTKKALEEIFQNIKEDMPAQGEIISQIIKNMD